MYLVMVRKTVVPSGFRVVKIMSHRRTVCEYCLVVRSYSVVCLFVCLFKFLFLLCNILLVFIFLASANAKIEYVEGEIQTSQDLCFFLLTSWYYTHPLV